MPFNLTPQTKNEWFDAYADEIFDALNGKYDGFKMEDVKIIGDGDDEATKASFKLTAHRNKDAKKVTVTGKLNWSYDNLDGEFIKGRITNLKITKVK